MSQQESDNTSSELNPQKELLAEAAAQIRADAQAREQAKPKNVGQGTLGLVGDSLGGAAIGAAALVMGPVQGYKQNGAKGILGGALGGLAVGVATTTLGIGSGIAKFAHGASKTADAFHQKKTNPAYILSDTPLPAPGVYKQTRDALYKDLNDQYAASDAPMGADADGLSAPVDNKLYDVLGVDVNASSSQIRKAYYRLAQQYHPDKHPNDPDATAKFQEISDAYQILSDPVKREEYHRLGESATSGEAMMDPKALFALMFSDFEHLVGDLATSTILSTSGEVGGEDPEANKEAIEARRRKKQQFQARRENHLVRLLNRRLEPWMAGDEQAFITHAKHEVIALRKEPFGRDLLKTVSYMYRKKAGKLLDHKKGPFTGVQTLLEDIGEKAHSFKSQVRALEGGVKAMTASSTGGEGESIDETARREAVTTVGAVWLASVIDIEATLKNVLETILGGDPRQNPALTRKAEGIYALGAIFDQA